MIGGLRIEVYSGGEGRRSKGYRQDRGKIGGGGLSGRGRREVGWLRARWWICGQGSRSSESQSWGSGRGRMAWMDLEFLVLAVVETRGPGVAVASEV